MRANQMVVSSICRSPSTRAPACRLGLVLEAGVGRWLGGRPARTRRMTQPDHHDGERAVQQREPDHRERDLQREVAGRHAGRRLHEAEHDPRLAARSP